MNEPMKSIEIKTSSKCAEIGNQIKNFNMNNACGFSASGDEEAKKKNEMLQVANIIFFLNKRKMNLSNNLNWTLTRPLEPIIEPFFIYFLFHLSFRFFSLCVEAAENASW